MPRKLISFHDEDYHAIQELAEDTSWTFQELMDEAVRDLLKKHGRPTRLREALKKSLAPKVVTIPTRQKHSKRPSR